MSLPSVPETKFSILQGAPLEDVPREGVVLIDPPLSGETNMAIDEALLRDATPESPVVLRVYRWEQPTLSLGYFQSWDDCRSVPGLSDLPWVRRRTGGGAIVHDQEITYSILIPETRNKTSKGHSELLYRAIHGSAVENLQRLGWDAKLSETCTCSTATNQKEEPFLCFSRRSPVDLIVGSDKIMGSAQRRTSAGLLQHGSLLIRHSPTTPELIGLSELTRQFPSKLVQEGFCADSVSSYNKDMREKGLHDAFVDRACEKMIAKAPLDQTAWVNFLILVLKKGLSQIVNCRWQERNLDEHSVFNGRR
jgi:lipoyl(octanoyl) transferase